jgi:hypothetical protein
MQAKLRRLVSLHTRSLLLLALLLIVYGCQPTQGLTMSRQHTADEFFTGPQLELARAIERNDMAALRRGAVAVDLNAPGNSQMTLMWFAVMQKNPGAIRTLVELGVHPSDDEMDGMLARTPLGAALMSDDTFYLTAMLDGGLSPNDTNDNGTPLLQRAVRFGTLNHVRLLVERGAEINTKTDTTAFDQSTVSSKPNIAIYLLEKGASQNTRFDNGVTTAWGVHLKIKNLEPGPLRNEFIRLRDMMVERGVGFPPPSPVEVREQMRAEGLTPVVPFGHDR